MASPHDSRSVYEMGFAPLDLVDVPVGRITVKLYPRITPAMPVHERAHAFQVNKAALKDLPTDLRLVTDALGAQLNASSTVEGILSDWRRYFNERWMSFDHLTILSFHDSKGARIDDTTIAGNPEVLKPVQDGAIASCRSQDVKFARVQCTLDFRPLTTIDPYPVSSILRVSYYIELPQASRAMTNGAGGGYTLISFLGVDDLRTLSPDQVEAQVLNPVLQNGPVLLQASDFNLQTANTNAHDIALEIDGKILQLAWHQVCASIFTELCPNYSNQPQAAIEHIRQTYMDGEGNVICTSVFAYYQRMMNAMRPFAGEARFPKSVCNALIDGLDKRLIAIFRRNYADHAILHDLDASYQRRKFPAILQAMQSAEEEVQSISAIARSSVGGGQAFPLSAQSFPSQAERTLAHYKSGGGYSSDASGARSDGYRSDRSGGSRRSMGRRHRCFGCGDERHPWVQDGVIICPNADKPGVRAAAAKSFAEFRERMKTRRANRKRDRPVDYNSLSEENKAKVKEAVLSSMATEATAGSGSVTPPARKKPMILIADVVVLSSTSHTRDILPAPIVSNFPHIHLQLGTTLNCPGCPLIRCVIDTAAALSTGNFHFVAAVAKQYPHCVAKLFVPEDYNPIVLSGIVQRGGESITTELTVGFQFHLPYLTREGDPTSILIATGPHVTVNTIVGLPFIQATRAIIDLADNVVELRALDAPPFPLEYRRATVHVPIVDGGDEHPVHLAGAYDNLIAEINALEQHFASANLAQAESCASSSGARSVTFGASPAIPTAVQSFLPSSALASPVVTGGGYVNDPMDQYDEPDMGNGNDYQ